MTGFIFGQTIPSKIHCVFVKNLNVVLSHGIKIFIKETVYPKGKILTLITRPHVVPTP